MKLFFRYTAIFLFLCQSLHAQTEKQNRFTQWLEKTFSETDTTYISPNKYNLTFMVEQSFWHERYSLKGDIGDGKQSISFAPNATPKIGAYFGWRWIFLGFSFSIPDLIKKIKMENRRRNTSSTYIVHA